MSDFNLEELTTFVNGQLRRTRKIYERRPHDNSTLPEISSKFEKLLALLLAVKNGEISSDDAPVESADDIRPDQLFISPSEYAALPDEMKDALDLSDSDKKELLILQAFDSTSGVASIDVLMLQIFKQSGEILERRQLGTKLFRMTKKGLVFPVPKRKSVYSTRPIKPGNAVDGDSSEEEELIE